MEWVCTLTVIMHLCEKYFIRFRQRGQHGCIMTPDAMEMGNSVQIV